MATNYVLQYSGKEIDALLEKVQNLPEDISTLKFSVANELPTKDIDLSTIYLVKTANEDYEEYIYINNNWEMLGTTKVDLTDYATKEYVDNTIANIDVSPNALSNTDINNITNNVFGGGING
jgi:hypothetical protein